MTNGNEPRLRQDKIERKDKENSNAGMIAGVIIVIIGLAGIFLYYNYESTSAQTTSTIQTPAPNTTPTNNNPSTSNVQNTPTSPGPQT